MQKTYSVSYQYTDSDVITDIAGLIGDGVNPEMPGHRWFIEEDGTRHEIPFTNCIFKFSKERTENIAESNAQKAKEQ